MKEIPLKDSTLQFTPINRELFTSVSETDKNGLYHWHNFYEFEITLQGHGTETINDIEYPMRRGEAHLIRPADVHKHTSNGDLIFRFIQFDRRHVTPELYSRIEKHPGDRVYYLDEDTCSVIETLFDSMEKISKTYGEKDPLSIELKEKLLEAVLVAFFNSVMLSESQANFPSSPLFFQRLMEYIGDNFTSAISSESIAKAFHFNHAYFNRYFRSHMGVSLKEYINSLRLKRAAEMLTKEDEKIIDVCMRCGYNSMTSFLRDFKKMHGLTPSEFKAKHYKPHDMSDS